MDNYFKDARSCFLTVNEDNFLRQSCNEFFFHLLQIEQYLALPKDTYITITLKEMYRMHELLYIYKDKLVRDEICCYPINVINRFISDLARELI